MKRATNESPTRALEAAPHPSQSESRDWELADDEAQIRFSLTALGEAVVLERRSRGPKFRGFGPCGRVA